MTSQRMVVSPIAWDPQKQELKLLALLNNLHKKNFSFERKFVKNDKVFVIVIPSGMHEGTI
jgi:hypothetical protein